MLHRFVDSRAILLVTALLMLSVPSVVLRLMPARAAAMATEAATCGAMGTYAVGRFGRVTPNAPPSTTSTPGGTAGSEQTVYPFTQLQGTLSIATYSGCGTTTAGAFTVHRTVSGLPRVQPQQGGSGQKAGPSVISCGIQCLPGTGVSSATGRFTQDPAHPNDPAYVMVSATITTTRASVQMGRPCTSKGCPPPVVITSTMIFTDVTGYLQVPAGTPQTVTLSFLPPPDDKSMAAPMALALVGNRGFGGVQQSTRGINQ